ncbi:hypothetical protein ACU4GD_17890 [Cupriavidus basilensis]
MTYQRTQVSLKSSGQCRRFNAFATSGFMTAPTRAEFDTGPARDGCGGGRAGESQAAV